MYSREIIFSYKAAKTVIIVSIKLLLFHNRLIIASEIRKSVNDRQHLPSNSVSPYSTLGGFTADDAVIY